MKLTIKKKNINFFNRRNQSLPSCPFLFKWIHSSPFWIAENLYAHLAHAAEPLKSTYAPLIVLFDHYVLSEDRNEMKKIEMKKKKTKTL